MQTAGHLVTAGAKFAAGMQHREHRFERALAGAGVDIGGDAAAVIGDGAGAVVVKGNLDVGAMAR